MPEIPRKPYYKPSEVCSLTDTQPYVLRFWESEFPQLSPKKGVYRRRDIELVLRIKELLNEQDCSIAEVRELLSNEGNGKTARAKSEIPPASAAKSAKSERARKKAPTRAASPVAKGVLPFSDSSQVADTVPRGRYEDALDEVAHLRLELQEAESLRRKAEAATKKALEENERIRERSDAAVAQIEQLIGRLS